MAVEASTFVWQQSKQSGAKLVVMLALADYAHPETGECFPGITKLAEKCRMTTRYLRRILNDLETAGELKRIHGAGVDTPKGSTNRYIIAGFPAWIAKVKEMKRESNGVNNRPPQDTDGVNNSSARGEQEFRNGVNNSSPNPLLDPLENREGETEPENVIQTTDDDWMRKIPGVYTVSLEKSRRKIKGGSPRAVALVTEKYGSELVLKALEIADLKDKRSWQFAVGVLQNFEKDRLKHPEVAYHTMSPAMPAENSAPAAKGELLEETLRKTAEELGITLPGMAGEGKSA